MVTRLAAATGLAGGFTIGYEADLAGAPTRSHLALAAKIRGRLDAGRARGGDRGLKRDRGGVNTTPLLFGPATRKFVDTGIRHQYANSS